MSKNENTHIPYENEPENYQQLRNQILDLMIKVNECKKEAANILHNDILNEQYGNDPQGTISAFNEIICFWGEAHGFLLSDDVIQNVMPK